MSEVLIYLFKVAACQAVIYAVFRLALSKQPYHSANRWVLLMGLLIAMIAPMSQMVIPELIDPVVYPMQQVMTVTFEQVDQLHASAVVEVANPGFWSLESTLWSLYLIGMTMMLLRFSFNLLRLISFTKNKKYDVDNSFKIHSVAFNGAFSFFKNIFLPISVDQDRLKHMRIHELAHARLWHSIDRVFMEVMVVLFWFNPFIYKYRNELVAVHEYQADHDALRQVDSKIGYLQTMAQQVGVGRHNTMTSHFDHSLTKKRIVMMNKNKKSRAIWIYYPLALMTVAVLLVGLTGARSIKRLIDPTDISVAAPNRSSIIIQNTTPAIIPLVVEDLKISSQFGMRNDPFSGEKKHHFGIDLKTPSGTKVVATADGTIVKVADMPNGYGKYLDVKHNEVFTTRYAQLGEFKVVEGDVVEQGQLIALSGNSGRSTAPHLHYEIFKDGKRVNPIGYMGLPTIVEVQK